MERLENLKVQIGILVLTELAATMMFQFSGMEMHNYLLWLMLLINIVMIV